MNAPVQVDAGAPKWVELDFGGVKAICRHADESNVASITNGAVALVTIGLMMCGETGPSGMFLAVPPDFARAIAAGLIEMANEIDGGKGKQ